MDKQNREKSSPIIFEQEGTIFFDCDETLVMHYSDVDTTEKVTVIDPYDGETHRLKPHDRHVKLLKDHKARGYVVVVWSANGGKWANAVTDALDIKPFVDLIIGKPSKYVDDLHCQEFMGTRIYLEDK